MIYKCKQLLQVYQLYKHRYKKIVKFYHLITIPITTNTNTTNPNNSK
jgi:hypothetical protein